MSGPIPGLWRLSSDDEGTISFEPYVPDLEALAEQEHEQWAHWTEYMLDNMDNESIARWWGQIATSYEDLDETEKVSDRRWARKALEVLGIEA